MKLFCVPKIIVRDRTGQKIDEYHLTNSNATNCVKNLIRRLKQDVISRGNVLLGIIPLPDKIFKAFGLNVSISIDKQYAHLLEAEAERKLIDLRLVSNNKENCTFVVEINKKVTV